MCLNSIRRQLLVGLVSTLTLVGCAVGVGVYYTALQAANTLFDYHLKQVAFSLRDHAATAVAVAGSADDDAEQDMVIQMWDDTGAHLYHSHPGGPSLGRAVPGWSTVALRQGAWRVFALVDEARVIQVEHPMHVRQAMAARMALRTFLPWLVAMPILGGLLWWRIGHSLQPLTAVAQALRTRTPHALELLPVTGLPQEVQLLVTVFNDLLQRLAAVLAAQREFIADAAHALRTPLAAVHLQAHLVLQAREEAARGQAIATFQRGIERISHLVQQLLTLARVEPEATQEPLRPMGLNPIVHAVMADHAVLAVKNAIDLGLVQDDPVWIRGDAGSLRLLCASLLENALHYTPAGGTVDVQLMATAEASCLSVADTGPGIPSAERPRVFDRFYRGANVSVAGSGLGLAIVHAVAERHQASVTLGDRDRGSGLVVRVTFPSIAAHAHASGGSHTVVDLVHGGPG
jgi:two-component system OmpR family sensor kinase